MSHLRDKYCIVGVGETEYSRGPAAHAGDGGGGGPQRDARRRASARTGWTA